MPCVSPTFWGTCVSLCSLASHPQATNCCLDCRWRPSSSPGARAVRRSSTATADPTATTTACNGEGSDCTSRETPEAYFTITRVELRQATARRLPWLKPRSTALPTCSIAVVHPVLQGAADLTETYRRLKSTSAAALVRVAGHDAFGVVTSLSGEKCEVAFEATAKPPGTTRISVPVKDVLFGAARSSFLSLAEPLSSSAVQSWLRFLWPHPLTQLEFTYLGKAGGPPPKSTLADLLVVQAPSSLPPPPAPSSPPPPDAAPAPLSPLPTPLLHSSTLPLSLDAPA
eukprot:RCo031792